MSTDDTRQLPPYPPTPVTTAPRDPWWHDADTAVQPQVFPGEPAAERPGAYVPPTAPQPPAPPTQRDRRWRRRAAAGAAALALALGSGTAGALIANGMDDDGVTTVAASPVSTTGRTTATEPLAKVAAAVQPSVVSILVRGLQGSGEGSGVVLRSDGTILTNNHVVESAADGGTLRVQFSNGRTVDATIIGRDPSTDLAVIRATGVTDAQPATLGSSDDINVGDSVLAIGSPLGLEGSVTSGIVSALHRPVDTGNGGTLSDAIQTDAAINPGNSGGALVDAAGRVIGINTAIATVGGGAGQAGNIGLGFSIPIDEAKRVADSLISGKVPARALLGVQAGDAPDGGAVIGAVTPNSAAAKAGLRAGDVITKVGDRTVSDAGDLTAAVRVNQPGAAVEITYTRDGQTRTATATLAGASG